MRCSGQLNVISTQMASHCVCNFFEWKQYRHFVWFSAFCKSFHSCSYVQLLVNHYSYQAAATSRRSFEQNVMLFSATGQRVFTCKNRRRYSRERASQSLEENSIHNSFASLGMWRCRVPVRAAEGGVQRDLQAFHARLAIRRELKK